jgi:hypothetical protein
LLSDISEHQIDAWWNCRNFVLNDDLALDYDIGKFIYTCICVYLYAYIYLNCRNFVLNDDLALDYDIGKFIYVYKYIMKICIFLNSWKCYNLKSVKRYVYTQMCTHVYTHLFM